MQNTVKLDYHLTVIYWGEGTTILHSSTNISDSLLQMLQIVIINVKVGIFITVLNYPKYT